MASKPVGKYWGFCIQEKTNGRLFADTTRYTKKASIRYFMESRYGDSTPEEFERFWKSYVRQNYRCVKVGITVLTQINN
jgi:hypothetical protein